jgi:hypothetical protein
VPTVRGSDRTDNTVNITDIQSHSEVLSYIPVSAPVYLNLFRCVSFLFVYLYITYNFVRCHVGNVNTRHVSAECLNRSFDIVYFD